MKNLALKGLLIIITMFGFSCSNDEVNPLSQEETDDLKFLREEEKLARDVYLYSFDKYNLDLFKNISNSEATHMGKVLDLLEKYNIEDPATDERGVFSNTTLQKLYDDLTAQSEKSLLEALKVGATIEDLDIKDIVHNEERTTNAEIEAVYSNLKCGSTNHMRSFNKNIIENGGTYTPQYISVEDFNDIINNSNQSCG